MPVAPTSAVPDGVKKFWGKDNEGRVDGAKQSAPMGAAKVKRILR